MENISVEQALEAAKGLTFEKVWLSLMESRQQLQQLQQKQEKNEEAIQRMVKENEEARQKTEKANEEARQRMVKENEEARQRTDKAYEEYRLRNEESRLRMDRIYEETQRQIHESQQRIEKGQADFEANMNKILKKLGNSLGQLTESMFSADLWEKFEDYGIPVSMQSVRHEFNEGKRNLAEADIYIQNGECAIPVGVKTNLSTDDIDEHLERIDVIRRYLDTRNDKRKLMGAVAGATVPENVMRYAWKKGLFVLVPSGESVTIADVPDNFKAREWVPLNNDLR